MAHLTTAYIGLGSNLGDRKGFIDKSLKSLAETKNIRLGRISDLLETSPLGPANQPKYLNAVAQIETSLSTEDLFKKLTDIENSLGRVRKEKWSPRTIDLDLLLFGSEIINRSDLTVPHRQMHLRSFVLKGLCQLNAELQHPVIKESMGELAARLNDADFALNPDLPQLVSVAGIIGVGKTTLVKKLSQILDCKSLFEPYDTNPYLPQVYAGKKELALDSQLYFLTNRTAQLAPDALGYGKLIVSDYIFNKELIYAKRLLNSQQLALYEQIYPPFAAQVAAPVLVIYLADSVQNCLRRIHERNRPYEQKIQPQFLDALNADHEQLFKNWKICPIIRISVAKFDCTKNADVERLANQIKSYSALK
jgi:2-amino-4-hydroxy-6-hydroxymethyldihydropteridine diphosphokinase